VYALETGGWYLRPLFVYPYGVLILVLAFFKIRSDRIVRQTSLNCDGLSEKINILQEAIRSKEVLTESLSMRFKRYSQLKDFTDSLTSAVSLEQTTKIILEKTVQLLAHFSSCILYLINPETYELNCVMSKTDGVPAIKTKKGDIFDHWVVKKMQPLLIEDVNKDFRFDVEQIDKEELRNIRSVIAAPLLTYNKLIGILRLDGVEVSSFNQEDLRLLVAISDLAAAAIDNAILYKNTLDLAIHDGLTSLYLKNYFLDRLEEELKRSSMTDNPLGLLMLDIDRFKDFNDRFGHIAGDIVLKTVSSLLLEAVGKDGNIVCRFGGEEFMILLVGVSKREAIRIAEDLRKKIKDKEVILRREVMHVAISIGVVSCPQDGFQKDDLLKKVDDLLLKAKRSGRDRVCFIEK
jgi:diguanylate cyclase (GGDEF)-like protein